MNNKVTMESLNSIIDQTDEEPCAACGAYFAKDDLRELGMNKVCEDCYKRHGKELTKWELGKVISERKRA